MATRRLSPYASILLLAASLLAANLACVPGGGEEATPTERPTRTPASPAPRPTNPPPPAAPTSAPPAQPSQPQTGTVLLVNNSAQSVCYVYISPTTSTTWGDDWLGANTIPAGSSWEFQVDPGTYDFRAEDCSGNAVDEQYGIELTSTGLTWTLSDEAAGPSPGTVRLMNFSGFPICYVYISPSTLESWGADWLGADILADGYYVDFTVGAGTYDLKAEDCEHNVMNAQYSVPISQAGHTWVISSVGTGPVIINNNLSVPICYVYISPSTDAEWGNDWLGTQEVIYAGTSRRFYVVASLNYDLLAEDCNHNELDSEYNRYIGTGGFSWNVP